jgi:hypothetical protein
LSSSFGIQAAVIPHLRENPASEAGGFVLAAYFTPPSSVQPSTSPTMPVVLRRCFSGQMPTSYNPSYGPSLPLPLAVIPSEHSPISPSAPAPFSAVKLPIQFASVGLFGEMIRNRVATRALKSPGLTSLRATALLAAPHEAAEAHFLDLP